MTWAAVLVASAACFGLKLAGMVVPGRMLEGPRVQRTVSLIPVGLLAALIAISTFSSGHRLVLDARAAALGVAAVAVVLRAPFLLVLVAAASTAAILRLL